MQSCRAVSQRGIYRLLEHGVVKKLPAFDRGLDTRVFLINDAAGADIKVPDFGVAHLRGGQADPLFGSLDERVRIGVPEQIPVRFARLADGIIVTRLAIAEAVEYD